MNRIHSAGISTAHSLAAMLAVHCKQTGGGQSIDVGLAEKSPAK